MLDEQVSGIIAQFCSTQRKFYLPLLQSKVPVVCIDHVPDGLSLDNIVTNNRAAMRQATAHLVGLGHRAFGLVGGPLGYITARERQAGFLDALTAAGIGPESIWIENGDWQIGGSYAAVNRLLDRTPRPLALVSVNNEATIAALKALQERQLAHSGRGGAAGVRRDGLGRCLQPTADGGQPASLLYWDRRR